MTFIRGLTGQEGALTFKFVYMWVFIFDITCTIPSQELSYLVGEYDTLCCENKHKYKDVCKFVYDICFHFNRKMTHSFNI